MRVSCIFVADGVKNRAPASSSGLRPPFYAETGKSRGFARSGALGKPGAGHGLAACLGVDLSKPEWLFVRYPHRRKADGCGGKDSVEWGHGH